MNRSSFASDIRITLPFYRIGANVLWQDGRGVDHTGIISEYVRDEHGELLYVMQMSDGKLFLTKEDLDEYNDNE